MNILILISILCLINFNTSLISADSSDQIELEALLIRLNDDNELKNVRITVLGSSRNSENRFHSFQSKINPLSAKLHRSFTVSHQFRKSLNVSSVNKTTTAKLALPPKFCPFTNDIDCDPTERFRSFDGSCNNLESPLLGRSSTPYKRLMKPFYDDKVNDPRKMSVNGIDELPNARLISIRIHNPLDIPSSITNLAVMFGQFIDHDFALSATSSDSVSSALKCQCGSSDPDCVNIPMPDGDDLDDDQQCMTLTRSGASFDKFDCSLNAREQLNLLTHFLDLSQIYGNDKSSSDNLRTFSRGLLRSSKIPGQPGEYLPFADPGVCIEESQAQLCFKSGDERTSQNLLLVGVHTIWLREHNRIAKQLAKLNPRWGDERLFQEARRICNAQYQNVIYSEWLPTLLGNEMVNGNQLNTLESNYSFSYDENVNPNLAAEFSTAAFRFGHSLIRSFVSKSNSNLGELDNLTLTSIFLRPGEAYKTGGLEALIRGLIVDPATQLDSHITNEVQNHLFENQFSSQTKRFSLSAINIMRGRDHGIPPYNEFREFSGLRKAATFDDLVEIPASIRESLRKLYEDVNDIDAFTGGISETPIEGGILGPTFSVIVAKQFKDLKLGDRFYFEHGNDMNIRFSLDQLKEIRSVKMASILCNNLRMKFVQENVFRVKDDRINPLLDCKKLKKLNVDVWKD